MLDLWYKNAVIYCLDVETFADSDGDGVGDFQGLTDKLDYIEALGATCVWLLPFYPTPNRDNGYDIADFYGVDPRLGSLGDFVNFTHAARDHGLRVIADLVVNHTSTDHPWFQAARSDPNSPYRNWYVWSEEKPKDIHEGVIFPGVQDSVWTFDEAAGAWYLHRFYAHQADLNIANPAVREEIFKIMGFWLQLGVTGFRVDAVPYLVEYKGVETPEGREDPLQLLSEMQDFLSWRRAEAVMLAEANVDLDKVADFFAGGERMHMLFHFVLNQRTFLAFARHSVKPIVEALEASPELKGGAQWATFLRNHDELNLGRLRKAEREEAFAAFGPDPDMQIYERGLRRRFAPMMDGDLRRMKMAYSLMFALPGTPVLWYGDEIGMGEDLSQQERNSVRAPMQWSDGQNAGFSRAPPDKLVRPVISEGKFGYRKINVTAQRDDPDSLMSHVQRLVRIRRGCPEVGWGEYRILKTGEESVLALRSEWQGQTVVTLHNLADREIELRLGDVDGDARTLTTLLSSEQGHGAAPAEQPIRLEPYGYRWYRLQDEAEVF